MVEMSWNNTLRAHDCEQEAVQSKLAQQVEMWAVATIWRPWSTSCPLHFVVWLPHGQSMLMSLMSSFPGHQKCCCLFYNHLSLYSNTIMSYFGWRRGCWKLGELLKRGICHGRLGFKKVKMAATIMWWKLQPLCVPATHVQRLRTSVILLRLPSWFFLILCRCSWYVSTLFHDAASLEFHPVLIARRGNCCKDVKHFEIYWKRDYFCWMWVKKKFPAFYKILQLYW